MAVSRLLVANRGEIAVRIIRAARALGIETVAVFSDADAGAPHVRMADAAVRLGPAPAHESYLAIDRVLAAAREQGADAVHPGYGFLSENAAFAAACVEAGLTFVGPSPAAMRALGDKARAKELAATADVPTVPSWAPDEVPTDAFPVLVKAAAGGGGRGMRPVASAELLPDALTAAAREAAAGFGDDTLLVERLVTGARHVEVQLLADEHGTCLYVGDRDCTMQRRHQKVLEEAPAHDLPAALHRALGEAAVRLARAAGYTNAGTAEFLVDPSTGEYFFLELNARLQVEHPATELAFGIDLVQWQLRIAAGEPLTVTQESLVERACAIEARLYAEDPVSLLPTGGRLLDVHLPDGAGVRVDHALDAGATVSLDYDPLLAKIIVSGATREAARQGLLTALSQLRVLGVVTNAQLLRHALELPDFVAGTHDTATLERQPLRAQDAEPASELVAHARHLVASADPADPFQLLGSWRGTSGIPAPAPAPAAPEDLHALVSGDDLWLASGGSTWVVPRSHVASSAGAAAGDEHGDRTALSAPMPGTVIAVASVGDRVGPGDPVVVVEAMKMENALAAPFDGEVVEVRCAVGDRVGKGDALAIVDRVPAAAAADAVTDDERATAGAGSA